MVNEKTQKENVSASGEVQTRAGIIWRIGQALKSRRGQCVISVFAAVLCAGFVGFMLPENGAEFYNVGLLPPLVAVLYCLLFRAAIRVCRTEHPPKRFYGWTAVLSLLISSGFVFGAYGLSDIALSYLMNPLVYIAVPINAAPFFAGLVFVWRWLDRWETEHVPQPAPMRKRTIALVYVAMLVCWLPIFLAAYPGFYCYDMGQSLQGEWSQYSTGLLTDHHSVLHTLAAGTVISVALDAGLSFNTGVAWLTVLQALIVSGIFTYCVAWLAKHGVPRVGLVLAFLFFAVNPSISQYALCTNSDTMFSAVALVLIMLLYDALQPDGLKKWPRCLGLTVFAVLLCILRPNGIYAFVLFVPFALVLAGKGNRGRLAICLGAALVCAFMWLVPAANALHVSTSNLQQYNALSMPIQQVSSVVDAGTLTAEEYELLKESGYKFPSNYDDDLVDETRDASVLTMPRENLIRCWLQLGWNHPFQYLAAFIQQTQDAWNPYAVTNASLAQGGPGTSSFFICNIQPPAQPDSKLPWLLDLLVIYSKELTLQRIPFLALLVSLTFYVFVMLVALIRSLIKRNHACTVPLLLFLLLVCSVLLGPGVIVRYYLYLLFAFPVVLYFLCGQGRTSLPRITAT